MMGQEILDVLLNDFRNFVKNILPEISVKMSHTTKGQVQFSKNTIPAIIYIPADADEYTQQFVLLHEIGHLYLNHLKIRQNELIPDMLAAAYMYESGYDPSEILSILEQLHDRYENILRVIVVFLLLYYLDRNNGHKHS